MDFSSLKDQVSNLTLYDLKAGVRKVQNGKLTSVIAILPYNDCDLAPLSKPRTRGLTASLQLL